MRLGKDKATGKQVAIKYIEKRRAFMDMNLEQECRLLRYANPRSLFLAQSRSKFDAYKEPLSRALGWR